MAQQLSHQTITVAGHFNDGTNAQTGVELINFNGATVHGYLLGGEDYFVSRADPGNRNAGGVNMAASAVTNNRQNFIAGETGTSDIIFGGAVNDLIFGGSGANRLNGGDGDDLMVGGADADNFDGGSDEWRPGSRSACSGRGHDGRPGRQRHLQCRRRPRRRGRSGGARHRHRAKR